MRRSNVLRFIFILSAVKHKTIFSFIQNKKKKVKKPLGKKGSKHERDIKAFAFNLNLFFKVTKHASKPTDMLSATVNAYGDGK